MSIFNKLFKKRKNFQLFLPAKSTDNLDIIIKTKKELSDIQRSDIKSAIKYGFINNYELNYISTEVMSISNSKFVAIRKLEKNIIEVILS